MKVAGDPRQIGSLVMLRSDHNTHSLTAGDRYVKMAFRPKEDNEGDDDEGSEGHSGNHSNNGNRKLRVTAPNFAGQAVPGIYLLYVVDRAGVPSVGARVDLKPDRRGH
ncbi:MAG: galactose oxidase-like domain-containing protein [Pyrinomonadaceae bacterium]